MHMTFTVLLATSVGHFCPYGPVGIAKFQLLSTKHMALHGRKYYILCTAQHVLVTFCAISCRSMTSGQIMAARKSVLGPAPSHPELDKLLDEAKKIQLTDEQIKEQRISFAYGR